MEGRESLWEVTAALQVEAAGDQAGGNGESEVQMDPGVFKEQDQWDWGMVGCGG